MILLATGGFFGNFVLSLTDHATNGFFLKTEWIPVFSSALATGFLVVPVVMAVSRRYLDLCLVVLAVQALVGIAGFRFHVRMNEFAPGVSLFERTIYGAPPMAPLLFPNLVALASIGMWEMAAQLPEESTARPSFTATIQTWTSAATPHKGRRGSLAVRSTCGSPSRQLAAANQTTSVAAGCVNVSG